MSALARRVCGVEAILKNGLPKFACKTLEYMAAVALGTEEFVDVRSNLGSWMDCLVDKCELDWHFQVVRSETDA